MTTYPHPACMEPDGGDGPCRGYEALAAEARNLRAELDRVKDEARWVDDAMVSRALNAFDTGTGDPNDYRRRMRAALEAAISPVLGSKLPKTFRVCPPIC